MCKALRGVESICKQRLFKQGAFLDEQVVLLVLSPCDLFRGCNPLVRAHLLPWLHRCLSLSACMLIASVLHASLVLSLSSVFLGHPSVTNRQLSSTLIADGLTEMPRRHWCSDVFFVLCYFILGFHFCILFWLRPLFVPLVFGYWYVSWSACRRHSPSQTIRRPAVCMSRDMHCLAAEVCAFSSLNCCCDFTHQLHSDNFQKGISRCTDLWHGIIWNPPYRYVSAHSLDCSFGVSVVTCSRMHLQTRCHLAKRRWTPCCRTPPFSGETQTVTGIWCCSGSSISVNSLTMRRASCSP